MSGIKSTSVWSFEWLEDTNKNEGAMFCVTEFEFKDGPVLQRIEIPAHIFHQFTRELVGDPEDMADSVYSIISDEDFVDVEEGDE